MDATGKVKTYFSPSAPVWRRNQKKIEETLNVPRKLGFKMSKKTTYMTKKKWKEKEKKNEKPHFKNLKFFSLLFFCMNWPVGYVHSHSNSILQLSFFGRLGRRLFSPHFLLPSSLTSLEAFTDFRKPTKTHYMNRIKLELIWKKFF